MQHRILIVSDHPFLRELVALALGGLDADIRCADDADQMLGLCRRTGFDLVILLRLTPFLCGRDVVRALRPAGLRSPQVYVVSWQQSEQTVLSLLECGVDQYMTFPVCLPRLRGKVAEALHRIP